MLSFNKVPKGPDGQLPSSNGLPTSTPTPKMLLSPQELANWPPKDRPLPGGGGKVLQPPGLPNDQLRLPTPNYMSGNSSKGYSNQATYGESSHSTAQGISNDGLGYQENLGFKYYTKKPSLMSRLFGDKVVWDENMYDYSSGQGYKVHKSFDKLYQHSKGIPIQIEPEKQLPIGKIPPPPPPSLPSLISNKLNSNLPEDFDYMPSEIQKFYINENKRKEKEWNKKFKEQEKLWKLQMKDWEKSEKERIKSEKKYRKQQEKANKWLIKHQNYLNSLNNKNDQKHQQHFHSIKKLPMKNLNSNLNPNLKSPENDLNNPYNFMLLPSNEFGVRRPFNPIIGGNEKWPNMSRTMTHAILDMNREEQLHAYHASLIRAPNW
ncbi:uncharacterized protein I206_107767 [Kwoniella pini CBS 10737]|uniref:Uncharacterized protein n=1 Tax=Kwoniella pini CBS 10737 TaxID=1296096 RepID=A0A1B9HY81_9TREE|nr:uncharacterized protein I206_06100 [Kwoniella pini CBS 10737]OCF48232.1 hypothetical protein I206_06100 [Kwoniella pini CBS 10737]